MIAAYNPYLPEPQLQSIAARVGVPQPANLLANGWEPLSLAPSSRAVIPGVSTNAVGKNFRVSHKIGMGSFGEIFLGVDIRTNERVAIKVENRTTKYPQLLDEYAVYRAVAKGIGVPTAIWCGSNTNVHIMVMELLGDSLETLYNNCGRKFSLKTITMLAIQLLYRIEHHHNHHYLHRDIKPDNFLMGPPQSINNHILYMVDMGLCKKYRDDTTLNHIPYRENKKLIGTPRYASINTHMGIEQCRRDDLESIGYMLVYFHVGRLPWQGLKAKNKQEKYDKISQAKVSISTAELCKTCPPCFRTYLDYCRQLRFTQKPDYKYLRSLYFDLFRYNGWKDDCQYDWMLPKGVQPEPTPARGVIPGNVYNPMSLTPQMTNPQMMSYMYGVQPQPQAQPQQAQAQPSAAQLQPGMAQRATTPQHVQSYLPYPPVASTPRPAAATPQPQPAASSSATPKPTSTPTPTPDLTAEYRRKIATLEASLAEKTAAATKFEMLYDKAQKTISAQTVQMAAVSREKEKLEKEVADLHKAARERAIEYTQSQTVIPLASAGSLKRRRAAAPPPSMEEPGTDDEEHEQSSAKKAKRRV